MTRDWGGFRSIIEEAKQVDQETKKSIPPDCPVCGKILDINARGGRNCSMGHYQDNGTPTAPR